MFNLIPFRRHLNDVYGTRNTMADFFSRFPETEFFGSGFPGQTMSGIRVDISETDTEFKVMAEVPGVKSEDLDIYADGRFLTIRGHREISREEKKENYIRIERSGGSFERRIALPSEVDTSNVEAVCRDGVLAITLKKTENAITRKIAVRAA